MLSILLQHQLFLECVLVAASSLSEMLQVLLRTVGVAYLGHIVSHAGVMVDNTKILAVTSWPQPTNLIVLRGFLGLMRYYRKFVKNYGIIAASLTNLLRKNCFKRSHDVTIAFEKLKKDLTTAPILTFPDFSQPFIVECVELYMRIGAILQQDALLISFYNHTLAQRHQKLHAYEKKVDGINHGSAPLEFLFLGSIICPTLITTASSSCWNNALIHSNVGFASFWDLISALNIN